MLNLIEMVKALLTDEYDNYSVLHFKQLFTVENEKPHAEIVDNNERHGMSIMAYRIAAMEGNVIVVDGNPLMARPAEPFPIKDFTIAQVSVATDFYDNPKRIREEKKQNQFRSRNHKK